MALGFGFNKTKVLASAEKYVQQGKLQNAINEYEKVVKDDPKDLTTLNSIGDLCARIGQNEKACLYFKKVGDAYALDGFTVKAIALYKKLTKLNPQALESIAKLAELYTQQGLYNDARSQYVLVADQYLRSGDNEQAVGIFQKILELDPENAAMRAKLADLYTKMGKRQEARNLYFSAAQSLYGRGALDAADQALERVLGMEPNNAEALMLRGQIAADSGDAANAIHYLEKIPDLDSRPDGLRAMLRALVQLGRNEEAEPLAAKLLNVHNDPSGLTTYAESLLSAGKFEAALKIYDAHADRFLSSNAPALLNALHASLSQIKNSAPALEILRRLFLKAGVTTHVGEISELLAHAWVEAGELPKARDLYKELAELEPENELHMQSYKQVVARLGEDSALRPLTPEEGAQAFMVDELEHTAPTLEVSYSEELASTVKAAITDSELFDSYNLPAKAIGPLESVLPKAPRDPQVNQRLASLYARANRFEEAARCCDVLMEVYTQAGHADQARQYGDMAAKYRERAGAPGAVAPLAAAAQVAMEVTPPTAEAAPAMQVQPPPAAAEPVTAAHEEDLSGEWESMMAVEAPPATQAAAPAAPVEAAAPGPSLNDVLEEAGFYLSQSMWSEAQAALDRAESIAPGSPQVSALRERLAAATAPPPAVAAAEFEVASAEQPSVAEFALDSAAAGEVQEVAPPPVEEAPPPPPPPPPKAAPPPPPPPKPAPPPKAAPPPPPPKPAPPPPPPPPKPAPPPKAAPPPPPPKPAPPPPAAAAPAGDVLGDFVLDLEHSLGDDFAIAAPSAAPPPSPPKAAAPSPAARAAPPPPPPSAMQQESASDALSDLFAEFKEDVETAAEQTEDPDTHYNLGVAFKEMGLLDEAIGELQKVCQAIEAGHPFSQVMQAYTWLAHCFVEKGVPQAAIKWYHKALKVDNLTTDSRLAVYYDLASAQEASGDTKGALSNFMEVYGTNIDYRDVAERIKALKS
jgi:tetratricopeptide (TPR) repeat protein